MGALSSVGVALEFSVIGVIAVRAGVSAVRRDC
jgi:hypothetical protein